CGFLDVSMHNGYPWNAGFSNETRQIGVMYAGRNDTDTADDVIYIGMNMHWEYFTMQLPAPPDGHIWRLLADTFKENAPLDETYVPEKENRITLGPRSIIIAIAEKKDDALMKVALENATSGNGFNNIRQNDKILLEN
ncbi:MAG: hypothetical protein IKN79_04955, partial [Eubacterium sp.]|nr:hypothetical protein [Eubacterium sp.]